ncbi:MAG: acyl-CoA thioesterase [Chloroflexota bacterium]
MAQEGKRAADSRVTLTQVMGPGEANILGNVHGGTLMKLCDEAGAMAATKHARRPAVTVAVDSMAFHSPVQIGNLVTVTAEITWTGRSSMETRVVVTAENALTGEMTHANTAYFVYVALDEQGRPAVVPPLLCETEEEQARYQRAAARQALRLKRRQEKV